MKRINDESRKNSVIIAEKLLNAEEWKIRVLAVKYASREKILEIALEEYDDDVVVNSILERLRKEGITEKEANTLLNVSHWKIRELAVKYASREKILERALKEVDSDVESNILEKLKKEEITEEEANTLLNAEDWEIREFAVKYASREKVLEIALEEVVNNVVNSILEGLEKEGITEEEANTLLNAKNWEIRVLALKYASREKILEIALEEEYDYVVNNILAGLKKEEITEEEANTLLNAEHCKIRKFAVKYASREKVLERALEEYDYAVNIILERIIEEGITEEEANILLNAEDWKIRGFAVKYASREKILERALIEKNNMEANSILERIIEEGITEEEANTLLDAEDRKIREFALKYASREKVHEIALEEEYDDVVNSILEGFEKEGITEEEANTLLNAKHWKIRELAVKYASKEKILKRALKEVDDDVVNSVLERIIEEGITKKEIRELLKSKNDLIRSIAKKIYIKLDF